MKMESLEINKLNKEISDILSKYLFKKNTISIRRQITDDLEELLQKYEEK